MTFYMDYYAQRGADYREINRRFEEYLQYLRIIEGWLPASAWEFAMGPWSHDHLDHRALHDSWVESMTVTEAKESEDTQRRRVTIRVLLLGPYHDGHTILEYIGVVNYLLTFEPDSVARDVGPKWHGDWLADEVTLAENGHVRHDILFIGGRWLIECADIRHQWVPLENVGGPE